MALSECCVHIDRNGKELIDHGTGAFPVACYQDDFNVINVPWHWHPEWEAVYIVAGSCTVAAGQQKRTLYAGDGFFINSGVLHGCWDLEGTGCMFHSIVFHPRLVGGSLDCILHQQYVQPLVSHSGLEWIPLVHTVSWHQEALEAIEAAWQACFRDKPGFEFTVRSALSSLILQIWKHMPPQEFHPVQASLRNAERIKTMLSYIHDNYAAELDLSAIAASASISESECLRCFRNAIGSTPIQYLKQFRLQKAAGMLKEGSQKVSDISAACGFSDISYFTKSFRLYMKCTPSEYRKSKRRS